MNKEIFKRSNSGQKRDEEEKLNYMSHHTEDED